VGTGGGGMHVRLATQGYQRSVLASHLASYGSCQYNSCYLALPEYRCLQQLHTYLTEEYNPGNHWGQQQQFDQQLMVLERTLKQFRYRYAKVDKGFLLENATFFMRVLPACNKYFLSILISFRSATVLIPE
jgi:hypothetical protein